MFRIIDYPPIRTPNYSRGRVLGDIESHVDKLPNQYQDKSPITSSHEQSHFLNSTIRNKYSPLNGYYLLDNRAALLNPIPNLTLRDIQKAVPADLHGMSFSLYLIQAQRDWGNNVLYLADEAIAYLNGAKCADELKLDNNSELGQAIEFALYLAIIADLSKSDEILSFQQYHLEECMILQSRNPSRLASVYLQKWAANNTYKKYLFPNPHGYANKDFL